MRVLREEPPLTPIDTDAIPMKALQDVAGIRKGTNWSGAIRADQHNGTIRMKVHLESAEARNHLLISVVTGIEEVKRPQKITASDTIPMKALRDAEEMIHLMVREGRIDSLPWNRPYALSRNLKAIRIFHHRGRQRDDAIRMKVHRGEERHGDARKVPPYANHTCQC